MAKTEIDYAKSQMIAEKLHTLAHLPRNELHLTDSLYCPMKAACRLWGIKPVYTRRTSGIFVRGLMFDRLVKEAFNAVEKSIKLGVSLGTPDIIDSGEPIEAKHTTKHIRIAQDIPEKWFEQLELECVYCGVKSGWLLIGEIDSTLVTAWRHKITKREFSALKMAHLVYMATLLALIRNGDATKFSVVREECPTCFYNYTQSGCPRRPGVISSEVQSYSFKETDPKSEVRDHHE